MVRQRSRRSVLVGCAAVGSTGLAGCLSQSLDAEERVTDSFDGDGISTLEASTVNGDVELYSEDRTDISLEGHKRATSESGLDDVTLDVEKTGDTLTLDADFDENGLLSWLSGGGEMNLQLTTPETLSAVTVGTTNGDIAIDVEELADITVETTNGDVEIGLPATAEPELVFETTNGDLTVTGLDAESVDADGSVETTIGDGTHRIDVETTNGDLDIHGS